ncbi:uncharacterized protein LOC141631570 [Silene latifolia]|uniref:uncharacterized protein LOC141631570 n=1 Tax=Silene latifolia TaxID=37657 RepID=UPI003D7874EE
MEKFATYGCSIPLTVGVTQDLVKQVLFPFSLKDGAAEWLRDLGMADQGVTNWNTLALAFYKRYFPPQKTNGLRNQITSFKQTATEDLNEVWVRFKRLVCSVTHHGFEKWFLCNQFYNGLYDDHRTLLDSSANGRFQDNTTSDGAWKLIDQISIHTAKYGNPRGSVRGSGGDSGIAAQLDALSAQIAEMKTTQSLGNRERAHAISQRQEESCARCGLDGHNAAECLSTLEQVHAFQSYRQGTQGTPFSNFYNERTKEHPFPQWSSQNVQNP